MFRPLAAAAAAFLIAAPAAAQQQPEPVDYQNPANWLCVPGRADACGTPLPTTALNPNGYGSVGRSMPASTPLAIDCFYVYPTVSRDQSGNSDVTAGPEEQAAATVQFARFSTVCRPFAPMYRQITISGLQSTLAGKATGDFALAYADVLSAWRTYLRDHNGGRPFVLIGHSQGTIMLSQLLAREIEGTPAAKRMLSAMLIGYNVEVPEGKLVGGTFKQTPLCSRVGETGCVVTYVSFRAANPPPAGALFGHAATPGMTVGCTNPARLRKQTTPLDSYWYAGSSSAGTPSPVAWSSQGAAPTPFLRTDGLVSAACVNRGKTGYLSVLVNADPNDARTDTIPGDVTIAGKPMPGWGLHLADMSLTMGDLIALVEAQAASFRR
jgi:hypothetical protein